MSIVSQIQAQIRRFSDDDLMKLKSIIKIEYDRRLKTEVNNKKLIGAS